MSELSKIVAMIIVTACVREQSRLHKDFQFAKSVCQNGSEYHKKQYLSIRYGMGNMADIYDYIINSVMDEYDLPNWDLEQIGTLVFQ